MIKQWVGEVPKSIHPELSTDLSAREPAYRVAMKVGPMSAPDATKFERQWKKESRSDAKVSILECDCSY